jgi:peptidoglycan/LPS O-acetylase OafA/YrhL
VLALGLIKPYFLIAFAPCFIPGVIAYCLWGRVRLPWQLWPPTLAVIVCAYALIAKHTFEGPRLAEWLACGAVAFTVPLFAEMPDSLVRRIAHLIAKYSFGIYLFHMACIWILFDIIKAPLPLQIAGFVLLLSALSFAAYRYIEAPFIRLGQSLLDGKFGALLSIASSQSDS